MEAYTKENISFCSADGKTQVAGYFYTPVSAPPRAVVQISHGMCEYIERYEPMIAVLCRAGYAVAGNDHLGHGNTGSPDHYGFFAEKDGYRLLLEDLKTMNTLIRQKYPGLKLVLLGHSMGSFMARWFAEKNPDSQDALVISGTGGPGFLMKLGLFLARLLSALRGPAYVSKMMVQSSTGAYDKSFKDEGIGAWLSRDPTVGETFNADPKCRFLFSASAYRDMLTAYNHVNTRKWARGLRKDMPVYIYSGDHDPVGNFGKGVRAVCRLLVEACMQDVSLRLYPGGRHEMHNETNREEVFRNLIAWLQSRVSSPEN